MVKKLYVCRECSYVFPEELSELIENEVQVFCEMCGTPFTLAGIEFKKSSDKFQSKPEIPYNKRQYKRKERSGLSETIKTLNKLSAIPLIIFSGIVLGLSFTTYYSSALGENWIVNLIIHLVIGFTGILIVIYDLNYISPKIKEGKYDEITLDSFCYGILGCIIFGTGVILLIKGVLILIYVSYHSEKPEHKVYNFGIKLKNSINYFSAKAGFIIIFLVVWGILIKVIDITVLEEGLYYIQDLLWSLDDWLQILIIFAIITVFCLFPVILLLIDLRWKKKIKEKQIFSFGDSVRVFILGVICSAFFGIGIFILLKGILIFFLFVGKPIDLTEVSEIEEEKKRQFLPTYKPTDKLPEGKEETKKLQIKEPEVGFIEKEPELELPDEKVEAKEEGVEEILHKDEQIERKVVEKDHKLRLHESLLPVKDEKDKKLVKEYFSKIFNVLSKNIREQIMALDISKKDRKELLKELAYLKEEEQAKYIEAISILYREIPRKLIQRIRKLKNVRPQHYDKIIEQLKFMDLDEQMEFVQFLEKNA